MHDKQSFKQGFVIIKSNSIHHTAVQELGISDQKAEFWNINYNPISFDTPTHFQDYKNL